MKKVFQIKLKNITRLLAVVIVASMAITGCKSYDNEITAIQNDVAGLKASVAALQTSVNGMTYIKSITMSPAGVLTITPSTGTAITYDAKNYVTYDISLTGNNLMVNGVNKGTVAIPALTFGADNKLMSGSTVVADLSGFVRTLSVSADNFLVINGVKSTIPVAVPAAKTVKDVTLVGTNVTVTYTDNTTTTFANAPIVATTTANTLYINGISTGVAVVNTFGVTGGFLTLNGVATPVAIPDATKNIIILNKVGGVVVSTTITDNTGATATIMVNPAVEPLANLYLVPSIINNGINAIELGYIVNIPVAPATAVKSLFTQPGVTYRLNPTSADVTKITAWNILVNSANINTTAYSVKGGQRAPGDSYAMITPTLVPNTRNDGSQDFVLKVGTYVEPAAGMTNTFALEATYKDVYSGADTKVASDIAKIMPVAYTAYISKYATTYSHYPTTAPAIGATEDFSVVYNATTKTNVNNLVLATAVKGMTSVENTFAAYGFGVVGVDYKFVFSVPTGNLGVDGVTDDNSFIQLESNGDITVLQGTASISRAPYVKVQLQTMAGAVLANGYIKLKITQAPVVTPPSFTYNVTAVNYSYPALFKGQAVIANNLTDYPIDWVKMNAIYTMMGLSHDQFNSIYGTTTPTVTGTFNGTAITGTALTNVTAANQFVFSTNGVGVDTYAVKYEISPMSKFGTYVLSYKYAPAGVSPLTLVFTFTVTAPVLDKSIIPGYQYGNATTVMTQGMNTGGAYLMQLYLGEAFGYGSTALQNAFGVATAGKIDGATHQFIITDPYTPVPTTVYTPAGTSVTSGTPAVTKNYSALSTTIAGLLGTGTGTGTLLGLNSAITVDRTYPINFQTTYPNGEVDNFNYSILFKNPLTIDLYSSTTPLFTPSFLLTDKLDGTADTKDISLNYQVKFLGQPIVTQGTTTATGTTLGYTSAGLSYASVLPSPVVYQTYSLVAPSTIKWANAGTKLTSTQVVGKAQVTYTVTNVATVTRTDDVSVQPGN